MDVAFSLSVDVVRLRTEDEGTRNILIGYYFSVTSGSYNQIIYAFQEG